MFGDIPGQAPAKAFFERVLRDGTLSHAYLLSGPEGLAKTAFARELGAALVSGCGNCGACPECERALRGAHPDLHVLEREGDVWRIAQVKAIVADLSLKPFSAARRVWVIPEIEYMNRESANKFLKSLEEPPSYVVFLLVTDRLERVLPTIRSRCQVVEFRPLSDTEVASHLLERCDVSPSAAEALARLSLGSVEKAARMAADAAGPGRREEYLKYAAAVVAAPRPKDGPAPADAFLDVLTREQAEVAAEVQKDLEDRLAEPSSVSSRTRRTSSGTWSRRRNAPSARLAVAGDSPHRMRSTCSSRGCATSGWSPPGHPMYSGTAITATRSSRGSWRRRNTTLVSWASPPGLARTCISPSTRSSRSRLFSPASRRSPPVPRICSVVFRGGGRVYQFGAGELELAPGDGVVVDTTRGADFGRVVKGPDEVAGDAAPRGLRKVLRKASAADFDAIASHREMECRAKRECRRLAADLKLDVKVVEARQAFDGPKLTITFFAEERTDARELQNRLGDRLSRRVELKQVSARDESRIVGGYGPCGRSLCCATFAGDQEPVSIRMAKDQNLPLNPTKNLAAVAGASCAVSSTSTRCMSRSASGRPSAGR